MINLICDELCELDLDVKNTDEFFEVMSEKAKSLGYVTDNFLSAIKAREEEFPTALPTEPYPVAIPHSDPVNIVKQFIAPIRLKNEIDWCEMANNESILKVRIVFLLGFKREEGHVQILQTLLENFQDSEIMDKLLNAKSKSEYLSIVKKMKGLECKRIVVACGNGVATSQSIAYKVNRLLAKHHINAQVEAVNLRSLERELKNATAYIEIMKTSKDYGVPKINGMAFLSGDHMDEEFMKLKKIIEES